MDAKAILGLRPRLERFLQDFGGAFPRPESRRCCQVYVEGQLSDLQRKSAEPIADRAGMPPRTLQAFLALHSWKSDGLEERLTRRVAERHAHPDAVLVIDETSDDKKGDKTPGVQRQWCGRLGKTENCIVTVHLSYAAPDLSCLLAGDLFLPKSWDADRARCRAAGIPDEIGHRTKKKIALDLLDDALARGMAAKWTTFDEGYGNSPGILRQVAARSLNYVAEVPKSFVGWTKPPLVVRRSRTKRGRPRKPHLSAGATKARRVEELLAKSKALREQPWLPYRIKDGEKGPLVWEAKSCEFQAKGEGGLPGARQRLVVARHPQTGELKYFVSNAADAPVAVLLRVAFTRWTVERCFEDGKQEVGFLHFEGRTWQGLKRHLALSALSLLFLQEVRKDEGKKKSGGHGRTSAEGSGGAAAALEPGPPHHPAAGRGAGPADGTDAAPQRLGAAEPLADHAGAARGARPAA